MEIIEQIQSLEKKAKDHELELVKLSEREKGIKGDKVKVIERIKELGTTEDEVEGEFEVLEDELKKEVETVKELLS